LTALSFGAVSTVDYHTGGEPFRIVAAPPVELPGATVAERRVRAIGDPQADALRRLLCLEPRGHADMYGGFLTPPDDAGADLGVLFWHKDGFSTACGHGTIALGVWAVETGRVQAAADGATEVRIDVPSGRVLARVHIQAGRVTAVDFVNVASYLLAKDVEVATSRGPVRVDIGFGGAIYAQLRADAVGLAVVPEQVHELLAIGREVKWLLNDSPHAKHLSDDRLSGIYGTVVFDELGTIEDGWLHQRNVTIFADGEVDRSPCGSGSAARVAVPHSAWGAWAGAGAGARLDRRLQLHLRGRRLADRRRPSGRDPPDHRHGLPLWSQRVHPRPVRPLRGWVRAAMSLTHRQAQP
jgi:proline racemase